jgi:hypothetical protein
VRWLKLRRPSRPTVRIGRLSMREATASSTTRVHGLVLPDKSATHYFCLLGELPSSLEAESQGLPAGLLAEAVHRVCSG